MNKKFVTKDLHKISAQIANATPIKHDALNAPEENKTEKPPSETQKIRNIITQELEQALIRRKDEYLRGRRDLLVRVVKHLAEVESDCGTLEKRHAQLQETRGILQSMQARLQEKNECDSDVPSHLEQAALAACCKDLENTRLELTRVIAKLEKEIPPAAVSAQSGANGIDLKSLTFGQLFRFGFSLSLPYLIVLFLGFLLLAIAVIGSFKGIF